MRGSDVVLVCLEPLKLNATDWRLEAQTEAPADPVTGESPLLALLPLSSQGGRGRALPGVSYKGTNPIHEGSRI